MKNQSQAVEKRLFYIKQNRGSFQNQMGRNQNIKLYSSTGKKSLLKR